MGDDGGGSLISLDGVTPSWIVIVSVSVIFPCTIKSRRFLLASAHPGSPGKRAIKLSCMFILYVLCYGDDLSNTAEGIPNVNALVAFSKGMWQ